MNYHQNALPKGVVQSIAYDLVECVKCHHVEAGEPPTSDEIHQYYTSDSFWKEQGAGKGNLAESWYDQVSGTSGLWERFNRAQNQLGIIRSAFDLGLDSKIIDLGSDIRFFCLIVIRGVTVICMRSSLP